MAIKKTNPDFLNGVPELLVLQLLARKPMHGYDVVRAVREGSGLKLDFGEGCIYPVLHRLEAQQLLVGRREEVGGRHRIIYRVTKRGQKRLAESVAIWCDIVAAVQAVMAGGVGQGGVHPADVPQGGKDGKPALA
jgi:PadR family transcriptional regulator PadR